MRVEVVFSPAARTVETVTVELAPGSTVHSAILATRLVARHGIDAAALRLSVWGHRCPLSRVLRDGDRIECCRPLLVDPKQARRLRSAAQAQKRQRPAQAGR